MEASEGRVEGAVNQVGAPVAAMGKSRTTVPAHLHSRARERQLLTDLLEHSSERGGTGLVEGPVGTGKTRLLAEAAVLAEAHGYAFAHSAVEGTDDSVPFLLLLAALERAIADSDNVTGLAVPPPQVAGLRPWPLDELAARLRAGTSGPVMITVDDLHAVDGRTVRRLREVDRRLSERPVAWLLARRPGEGGREVERLFENLVQGGARRIELEPLPPDDATALVADVLGAAPDDALQTLLAGAGGNPRLLVELSLGLLDEDVVDIVRGSARLVTTTVPKRIRMSTAARIDRLGTLARRLVQVTAAIGGSSPLDQLAHLLRTPISPALTALAEATAAGLLTTCADAVTFQQDLIRSAVTDAVPAAERQALRAQVAALRKGYRPVGVSAGPGTADPSPAAAAPPWSSRAESSMTADLVGLGGYGWTTGAADDAAGADVAGEPDRPAAGSLLANRLPAAMAANIRSRFYLAAGRVEEAVAEARLGLADAEQLEQELLVPLALSTLATVALRRGDLTSAAEHIERCRQQMQDSTGPDAVRITWLAGQLAAAQGDESWAMDTLVDLYDDRATLRLLVGDEPVAAAWLVRNAVAADDRTRAREVAGCAEALAAEQPDNVGLAAGAAHARGLLTGHVAALERAAGLYRDPWARASAAEDLGVLMAGDAAREARARAIQNLDDATSGYEATGAERDAARVRGRLRRLGIRRQHWSRSGRPASGWASLTGTERAVADLVAAGLTNRQVATRMFLSPHTVAFHLRHIFRKLEVTSRVDLARLMAQRVQDG